MGWLPVLIMFSKSIQLVQFTLGNNPEVTLNHRSRSDGLCSNQCHHTMVWYGECVLAQVPEESNVELGFT